MCVCACHIVCAYICAYVRMCCAYVCMCVCICTVCMCCVCVHVCVCVCTCVCVCVCTCVCVCVCACVFAVPSHALLGDSFPCSLHLMCLCLIRTLAWCIVLDIPSLNTSVCSLCSRKSSTLNPQKIHFHAAFVQHSNTHHST